MAGFHFGTGFWKKAQGGLPYTPPSEILSAIHSAWSVRKVVTAYSGPCIRVRRSTDNAELDINFDSNGYLDTASLLSFAGVGTTNCTIVTWYDQSGNGYDLTSTGANQPFIVSAGTLNTQNSLAAITFNASRVNPHLLQDAGAGNIGRYNFLHNGDSSTIFGVATYGNIVNPADLQMIITTASAASGEVGINYFVDDRPAANNRLRQIVYEGGAFTYSSDNSQDNAITPQAQSILYIFTDANNATAANRSVLAVNNGASIQNNSLTRAPSAANQSKSLQLGRRDTFNLKGSIQEIIICNADESSNKAALRDNQNSYYSTY